MKWLAFILYAGFWVTLVLGVVISEHRARLKRREQMNRRSWDRLLHKPWAQTVYIERSDLDKIKMQTEAAKDFARETDKLIKAAKDA